MCGIVIVKDLTGQAVSSESVDRMVTQLHHRGPDDEGTYFEDDIGLGFRRLAILDLSPAGHQPMQSQERSAVIVFNGQIFNYIELRDELRARGHRFRSTGDTEVLLRAYLEWGHDCLSRLNGEWAFVIWDRRTRTLFGSRDRMGVKPMYRVATSERIAWASELKALLTLPGVRPTINWQVAGAYLRDGQMDHTGQTFFQDIESVPAGHAFTVSREGVERRWQYWKLPDPVLSSPPGDPPETFAAIFEDAVRIRLRSDVPLGVSLSGGLDSTSIICAAERSRRASNVGSDGITAFLYHHPEFDERKYVAATVEQTGARVHRLEMDHSQLWDKAEQVVRAHDEPLHSLTAIVGYELMGLVARCGIRVALGGQGADEVLGGYGSYFLDAWYTGLRRGRPLDTVQQIRAFAQQHGGNPLRLGLHALRRFVQGQFQGSHLYRSLAHRHHQKQRRRTGWFAGSALTPDDVVPPAIPLELNQVLGHAARIEPLPLYLRLEDRSSMAHSVEVRLPFLDYRLVEAAFRLGPEWKVRGPWNKVLLRQAMKSRIPEVVRTRPDKMGFPSPNAGLLRDGSFDRLFALVTSQKARERGIYVQDRMIPQLQAARGTENLQLALDLFRVAQFETWAGLYRL